MAGTAIATVSAFLQQLGDSPLPEEVRTAAKHSLVDWFAVGLGARIDREAMLLAETLHGWNSSGRALAFDGRTGSAAPIALINGTFAHVLDYDDFHISSVHHAGGPTFAAALALGTDRGLSGADMLRAFVAGFEVSTRFGMNGCGLALAEAGWHPTGVLGHLSAVVAAASLLRFDPPTLERALGMSLAQVGGLMASAGTIAKPFLVGKSAFNGIVAAELAERGIAAPAMLLDGHKGVFATLLHKPLPEPDLATFGTVWETAANTFKPHSSCQLTHGPIDAARAVRGRVDPQQIEAIRLFVNPFALRIAGRERPETPLQAKFSMKHCVAMTLLGIGSAPGDFNQANLVSNEVIGLRDRITVIVSDEIARTSAAIEVTLRNGAPVTATVAAALGSLDQPMSPGDIDDKFLQATAWMAPADAAALLDALKRFDESGACEEVTAIVVRWRDRGPPVA